MCGDNRLHLFCSSIAPIQFARASAAPHSLSASGTEWAPRTKTRLQRSAEEHDAPTAVGRAAGQPVAGAARGGPRFLAAEVAAITVVGGREAGAEGDLALPHARAVVSNALSGRSPALERALQRRLEVGHERVGAWG